MIPETVTALQSLADARIAQVHTCLPGAVVTYSAGRATVQVMVNRQTSDGQSLAYLPLVEVPVQWPSGTGWAIRGPRPKPGDEGMVYFAERCCDIFLTTGQRSDAGDPRRFDVNDAFFVPGSLSDPKVAALLALLPDDDNLWLANGTAKLKLAPTGQIAFGNAVNELIDIVWQLAQQVGAGSVSGSGGPLNTAPAIQLLALRLATMRTTL